MIAQSFAAESTRLSVLLPPPLRGRVGEGGDTHLDLSAWGTPLSAFERSSNVSPPQGGREHAVCGALLRQNGWGFA
jgi:hypothetical protein